MTKTTANNVFTIDAENNITFYPALPAAWDSGNSKIFATEEQLAELLSPAKCDGARLLEIWNSLPGVTPVKKFTSRKVATARIWKAIQNLAGTEAAPAEPLPTVDAPAPDVAPEPVAPTNEATAPEQTPTQPKAGREGTKESQAIAMMRRPGGATLPELMATFGWQAHTVRGFVAGALTKKLGLNVVSSKEKGGQRTYTIAA
jgi:hypothetical protein